MRLSVKNSVRVLVTRVHGQVGTLCGSEPTIRSVTNEGEACEANKTADIGWR